MNFKRAASMAFSSDSSTVVVSMVVVVWVVRVGVRWTVAYSDKDISELGRAKAAEHSEVVALAMVAVLVVV